MSAFAAIIASSSIVSSIFFIFFLIAIALYFIKNGVWAGIKLVATIVMMYIITGILLFMTAYGALKSGGGWAALSGGIIGVLVIALIAQVGVFVFTIYTIYDFFLGKPAQKEIVYVRNNRVSNSNNNGA